MKKLKRLLMAVGALFLLGACSSGEDTGQTNSAGTSMEAANYNFDMTDSQANKAGTATVQETEEGVEIHLNLEGVPAGEYGMHIHEFGAATPPSFEDAGSHFNPTEVEHGTESETGPHLGDLPNLVVPENGVVNETIEVPDVSLDPTAENSLQTDNGASLIIHDGADDYSTQPSGDSGNRMIGGVISQQQ